MEILIGLVVIWLIFLFLTRKYRRMQNIVNSMSILIEKRGGYIISSIECENIAEVLNIAGISTYSRCIPLENDSLDYYEFIMKGHEFSIMPLQEKPSHTRLQYLVKGTIDTSGMM